MTLFSQPLLALEALRTTMGSGLLLPVGFASLLTKVKVFGVSQTTGVLVLAVIELIAVATALPSLARSGRIARILESALFWVALNVVANGVIFLHWGSIAAK
jgi:hypothetical protein